MTELEKSFSNKCILLVGGAGSLGRRMAEELLKPVYNINSLRTLDINENELARLRWKLKDDSRTRWLLGNILDKDRMIRAMENVDIVFMLAAQKHVDLGETNPFYSLQVNVLGAQTCIEAAINSNVDKYIYTSSDKAVHSCSTYGHCKKLSEALTLDANKYKGDRHTKFSVVRPCNYAQSDGSIWDIWAYQKSENLPLTVTDERCTRYFLTFDKIITFILKATCIMQGGEIFIPQNADKVRIIDLAKTISENIKITGLRPGEKLEEVLIDPLELARAEVVDNLWIVKP